MAQSRRATCCKAQAPQGRAEGLKAHPKEEMKRPRRTQETLSTPTSCQHDKSPTGQAHLGQFRPPPSERWCSLGTLSAGGTALGVQTRPAQNLATRRRPAHRMSVGCRGAGAGRTPEARAAAVETGRRTPNLTRKRKETRMSGLKRTSTGGHRPRVKPSGGDGAAAGGRRSGRNRVQTQTRGYTHGSFVPTVQGPARGEGVWHRHNRAPRRKPRNFDPHLSRTRNEPKEDGGPERDCKREHVWKKMPGRPSCLGAR